MIGQLRCSSVVVNALVRPLIAWPRHARTILNRTLFLVVVPVLLRLVLQATGVHLFASCGLLDSSQQAIKLKRQTMIVYSSQWHVRYIVAEAAAGLISLGK